MLTKQGIDISFAEGLDTKTDPKRVKMGKFRRLVNSVFDKTGLLKKRAGYAQIPTLPSTGYSYLTTFNGNLTAVGENIAALNDAGASWVSRGDIQPLSINTLPLLRNNLNQIACDSAVSSSGVVLTAYLESDGSTTTAKYVVADAVTGQNLKAPAVIPVSTGTVTGGMRVFILRNNFIMVFTNVIAGTSHLQYVTVSINNPSIVGSNVDIVAAYTPATTVAWDGYVVNDVLYIAYNNTSGGQSVKVTTLSSSLVVGTTTTFADRKATIVSVTADMTNMVSPVIYVSFASATAGTTTAYTAAIDQNIGVLMGPVQISTSAAVFANMVSAAQNGTCTVFVEIANAYTFNAALPSNYVISYLVTPLFQSFNSVFGAAAGSITVSSAAGLVNGMYLIDNTTAANITPGTTFTVAGLTLTLSSPTAGASAGSPGDSLTAATKLGSFGVVRSVGLASKAFIVDGVIYFLAAFQSPYQPTYFLINGSESTDASPVIAGKLAYGNGGGYLTLGLPNVSLNGAMAQIPYLFKDLIQAVNKNTNVPAGNQVNGIYSQTGVNLGSFTIGTDSLSSAEIGNDLHLSGGFLWMYDGYLPVEQNFFLYPDTDITTPTNTASWSASGGSIAAKPDGSTNTNAYFYQFTYEWTDNQGNAFRSSTSIPVAVTTTGAGTAGSITLNIPTLRLTMKTANPVKIVIYRWSVAQPIYYQVTSITSPTLNSTTVDSITYVDTLADATILGNNVLYTTGGVAENTNAPGSDVMTLFDARLWLVDAEDRNLLWFSKQVIEATPVEMSALFTVYVPPTTGTQGSTGPIKTIAVMDDKLILGKTNAFVYINGTGPDNTGANNQYSQATFITSTVGCANQKSVILTPSGLMFESDKGIWILGRDLSTNYIGAPVEDFTRGATVTSAVSVPETNQVRFTLSSGITLMYDYFQSQWGTFSGVPAISSCIYQGQHTFINSYGRAYQEEPDQYLDGSIPTLMSFKTGPIRLDQLQSYQRAYFFYLLGTYISPHKLLVNLYYDYSESPSQSIIIEPGNYSTPYGAGASQSPYGQGDPYGGPSNAEDWRIFLEQQRCMAIAIEVQEIFDPSFGTVAGAGLTLSGINMVCGFKKAFRPQAAAKSAG